MINNLEAIPNNYLGVLSGPILVYSTTRSEHFENANVQYKFKKCVVINMFIMAYAVLFEIIILSHKLKIIISGLDTDNLDYVI